jgi:hypothetical protein
MVRERDASLGQSKKGRHVLARDRIRAQSIAHNDHDVTIGRFGSLQNLEGLADN